jgi:hypothetical protein
MSLIQEFKYQAKVLDNADFQVITGRVAALFEWMESQPEIKQLIDGLRSTGPGMKLLEESGMHNPPKARTNEEIAMVGLELMAICKEGKLELWNIAMNCGIQAHNVGNSIAPHSEKALTEYVLPFLNYILNRLPEEVTPAIAGVVVQQVIPVAIQESLQRFREDFPDPKKVCFIMMRFGETTAHKAIETAIKNALKKYGFTGLLARDKEYNEDLYPNIQTYMHGCGFGIAVFERIESDDFNPNVSLEVGYLLGLKKLVLLLKDKTLETLHTDLVGKLYRSFDPLHPDETIASQVEQWLEDKGMI